jgi:signal transduction histidine kinase
VTEEHSLPSFLDRQVAANTIPVSLGLGILYSALAVAHGLVLPPEHRAVMSTLAFLSAAGTLGLAWQLRTKPLPDGKGHAVMAALIVVALVNSAAHIHLLAEPKQTTNFMLLLAAMAIVLLDHRWFVGCTLCVVSVWAGLWALAPPSPLWSHYAFAIGTACLLSVVLHLTHRRRLKQLAGLQEKSRRQQRQLENLASKAISVSRGKSRFIAHLSHEMRTPLNAIIGFANLLGKNRQQNLDDKQLLYIERISGNGRHLLRVINQVLDLSSLEADRLETSLSSVDLRELAGETLHELHPLARDKGLVLHLEAPARLQPIETDRHRLKQILINLLGNAIKFTEHGSVTLRLRGERQSLRPLAIVVHDTGPGIAADRLEHIFEPYEQSAETTASGSSEHSTGLGLAITRLLCQRLGMHIKAESTLGKGSKFIVQLVDSYAAEPPLLLETEATGTLALMLRPDSDQDGIPIQSGTPKEDP